MRVLTYTLIMGIGFTFGLLCGLLVHLPADTLPASPLNTAHHAGRARRDVTGHVTHDAGERVDAMLDLRKENGQGAVFKDNMHAGKAERFTAGSANKQILQSALVNEDYPSIVVKNPRDNPLSDPVNDNTNNNAPRQLRKYGDNRSDSVVYVNPEGHRLVLDNNVNKANDTYRSNTRPRGLNQQLGNTEVVGGGTGDVGRIQNEANVDVRRHDKNNVDKNNSPSDGIPDKTSLIKDGIFWGPGVESSCPIGFNEAEYETWSSRVKTGKFVKMETGCGRMQNRKLHFLDSTKACARYRLNVDQIQGEIYSFYLSKLLGINNVVPSTLHLADSSIDLWRMVGQEVANAQWSEEKPMVISEWINNLSPAYIPVEFRNLSQTFRGKDVQITADRYSSESSNNVGVTSLCDLFQWSDLIVFDYLTANLDRVVNNLFNLQWNDKMMSKPAHNLERDSRGSLVFVDNESGLFHGYRLLEKYSVYHESLLGALCVFREGTIRKIRELVSSDNVGEVLQSVFESNEPLHRHLPRVPVKNIKILKERMLDVLRQVDKCDSARH